MSLMSKCCSGINSGMISAPVGSPWILPNPPPWHFSALTMQATGRSVQGTLAEASSPAEQFSPHSPDDALSFGTDGAIQI
jgi:hypothetical protein